jgi:sugar-phosphatase
MDGTLVDSASAIHRAWARWAVRTGVEQPELQRALGGTSIDTIRALVPEGSIDEAHARFLDDSAATAASVRAVSGAEALLGSLPEGSWGVVTSSTRHEAELRMRAARLPCPRLLVTADDYAAGKPAPDPYLVALDAFGVDAEATLTFEDSPTGIRSAVAAGIRVIGVATYLPPRALDVPVVIADFTGVRAAPTLQGDLDVDVEALVP